MIFYVGVGGHNKVWCSHYMYTVGTAQCCTNVSPSFHCHLVGPTGMWNFLCFSIHVLGKVCFVEYWKYNPLNFLLESKFQLTQWTGTIHSKAEPGVTVSGDLHWAGIEFSDNLHSNHITAEDTLHSDNTGLQEAWCYLFIRETWRQSWFAWY